MPHMNLYFVIAFRIVIWLKLMQPATSIDLSRHDPLVVLLGPAIESRAVICKMKFSARFMCVNSGLLVQ